MAKAKAKVAAVHGGGAAGAAVRGLVIELAAGEKDAQNLPFHATLLEAWDTAINHFPRIVVSNPLSIADGGSQAPFNKIGRAHV